VGSGIFYNDKIAGHACENMCGLMRVFGKANGKQTGEVCLRVVIQG